MHADQIEVGGAYAAVLHDHKDHPIRVIPSEAPEGGTVAVTAYFPDSGADSITIETREIVGLWDGTPTGKRYTGAVRAARDAGKTYTWADAATDAYGLVRRQRALAGRLATIGIIRRGLHYAGRGGQRGNALDRGLSLNYDETERLLDAAERGPGGQPLATAGAPNGAPVSTE